MSENLKWETNLIKTQPSQDWYLSQYDIIARNWLHSYSNLKELNSNSLVSFPNLLYFKTLHQLCCLVTSSTAMLCTTRRRNELRVCALLRDNIWCNNILLFHGSQNYNRRYILHCYYGNFLKSFSVGIFHPSRLLQPSHLLTFSCFSDPSLLINIPSFYSGIDSNYNWNVACVFS